ncbi:MAG: helix-turn-helix domain-containing protein [Minwuia sp.]|nr:helix-turn-helix domain-containing protein [Minwuia sp.]
MPDSGRDIPDETETRGRRLNLHEVVEPEGEGEGIYRGVGAELRAEREHYGLLVSEVAERLRIRAPYLEAIEAGKFGDLPGRIYAIGFLRSYAEFLGADGDVCVQMFKDEAGTGGHSRRLEFPVPQHENRRPGTATLLIAVLLGAAVYGGWFFFNGQDDHFVDLVPAVPDRIARQVTPEVSRQPFASTSAESDEEQRVAADANGPSPRSVMAANAADARPDLTADLAADLPAPAIADVPLPLTAINVATVNADTDTETPAGDGNTAAETVIRETAEERGTDETGSAAPDRDIAADAQAQTDSAVPEAPVAVIAAVGPPPLPPSAPRTEYVPRVFGVANRDARIVIRATEQAQILVKQAGGRTVLPHRVLRAGDEYRAPDLDGLLIRSNNVSGLQLIVDGKELGSVARLADRQNNLALDADWLLANSTGR